MQDLLESVLPLISPALQEKFLIVFPSHPKDELTIHYSGFVAEIDTRDPSFHFTISDPRLGKVLQSGGGVDLNASLQRALQGLSDVGGTRPRHFAA